MTVMSSLFSPLNSLCTVAYVTFPMNRYWRLKSYYQICLNTPPPPFSLFTGTDFILKNTFVISCHLTCPHRCWLWIPPLCGSPHSHTALTRSLRTNYTLCVNFLFVWLFPNSVPTTPITFQTNFHSILISFWNFTLKNYYRYINLKNPTRTECHSACTAS